MSDTIEYTSYGTHELDEWDDPYVLRDYACDLYHAATLAARDYYDNHDGWESSWPVEFRVRFYKNDGESFEEGVFSIELDFDPSFYANKQEVDYL